MMAAPPHKLQDAALALRQWQGQHAKTG
jgi:hypothetical protein